MRPFVILGTGSYLPPQIVTAEDLDGRMNLPAGSVGRIGVQTRHFVIPGTASSTMGAQAAWDAIKNAGLKAEDIDCIIGTSGTPQQLIPCTAALIQRELGLGSSGIPAFDINATCLSFLPGLDFAASLLQTGRHKHILLVSADIASVGLNWNNLESASIFGDGAAAAVVTLPSAGQGGAVKAYRMETYADGADLTRLLGGGSLRQPQYETDLTFQDFTFQMDGKATYRMASKLLPSFLERLLAEARISLDDIDLIIPHQASPSALELVRKFLKIPPEKFVNIIANHGNTIAASMPMALHHAIANGKLKRGNTVLMLGTGAGLSIGGAVFVY